MNITIDRDLIQGSEEWLDAKLGTISSSRSDKFITSTGAVSKQATATICELVAERRLQESEDPFTGTFWMDRGIATEERARETYEFDNEVKVERVGLITNHDMGCMMSPDSLVGDDGILEIKCPKLKTHLLYYYAGVLPVKYKSTMHAKLAITGRQWADFYSYHPYAPPLQVRVEADDFTAAMRHALTCASQLLEVMWAKLVEDLGTEDLEGSLLRWPLQAIEAVEMVAQQPTKPAAAQDANDFLQRYNKGD